MLFTDPPYNVNIGTIKHPKFRMRPIEGDDQSPEDWKVFCDRFVEVVGQFVDGCVYVCHAPNQDGRVMASALDAAFHCSTTIIWLKGTFVLGRGKYQNQYEAIWFGWVTSGKRFSTRNRTLTNVWQIDRPGASDEHPTMKPIQLMTDAIYHASQPGDVVLDPFLGSGSTMIAADRLERVCFGVEIEPKYCAVTLERMLELGRVPKEVKDA
jgi:site-specific DNA-methyltransferase (adenine-specific)